MANRKYLLCCEPGQSVSTLVIVDSTRTEYKLMAPAAKTVMLTLPNANDVVVIQAPVRNHTLGGYLMYGNNIGHISQVGML